MSDIFTAPPAGHNNPPDETIEEIVRTAQQTRDERDRFKRLVEAVEAPFLDQAAEASRVARSESTRLAVMYQNLVTRIGRWQAAQRRDQPFADERDVSRVIIDGEVAATIKVMHDFEITDANAVPREFCQPSDAKIKAELAMGREVPGVARTKKYSTIIRG